MTRLQRLSSEVQVGALFSKFEVLVVLGKSTQLASMAVAINGLNIVAWHGQFPTL